MIRRIVPGEIGPTGGPAFTDLLGVCTAWGDGVAVVQPDSGPAVTIPVELIVSGKPVPPRPPVRHRVSVRDAELHTTSLSPGVETHPLGEWLLRSEPSPAGRIRKRFNSCLAVGDPGLSLEDAAAEVVSFYADRGRQPLAQVELGSDLEDSLRARGWEVVAGGDAHYLLGSVSRIRRNLGVPGGSGAPGTPTITVDGTRLRVTVGDVAQGEAALEGDWLGVHGLAVAPPYRRRGLARAVMAELLEWGAEQGATTVWLHVETDNDPALALYESLGLAQHHTMRYLAL